MDYQQSANKLAEFMNQQAAEQVNRMSEDEAKKATIIALLGALGATQVGDDSISFQGDKLVLPTAFEGRVPDAIEYLKNYYHAMEKHYEYNRTFRYRPHDGANAFHNVTMKLFGTAGIGKNREATFFNPERPPVMETINVGLEKTTQIPWGKVEFTQLDATFNVGGRRDPELGDLFHLSVDAPKKYKRQINAFYEMVEKELKENSIYRGKSITGADNPTYLDTSKVDPAKVVYSAEVMTQLETAFWSRLRYTEAYRQMGLDLKRAVLLEGPYGCIQGDAEMTVNRGGNGFKVSLKNLVKRFNGEDPRYSWDPSIPTYVQREMPDGTIRLGEIANAWYSGQKQTYTITTNSGRTLRATDEHPFLTERGWLRLDEMVVGDLVHVRGVQVSNGSQRIRGERKKYRSLSVGAHHPFGKGNPRSGYHMLEHRLVVEAADNGMSLVEFVQAVKSGNTEGLKFLSPSQFHVHHKDDNSLNNDLSNLEKISHRDHAALHGAEAAKNVLYKATTETVVSVEPYGAEDTYDIEVVGDPHNFLANGFVVHNTGKSLAGMLTAQEAEKNGWTYILCRSGQDDLFKVLQTAQLYAPAVVWFEDIDVVASGGDPEHISRLLDVLDGVQGKGSEILAGFTTNFVDKLQKGVLRPGRIDNIIHIGELDAEGYQKLIKSLVQPEQLGDIDYDKVQASFAGFLPAFVSEAIKGALSYALTRNNGNLKGIKINTDDLQNSALALRPQLELMNGAKEGANKPTLDSVLKGKLAETLNKTEMIYDSGTNNHYLEVKDN